MVVVYCTERFLSQINSLLKKNSYSEILIDTCDFLTDKDVIELHKLGNGIFSVPGKYSLNKYRVPNSVTNRGKSGSYRCISACFPDKNYIVLDYIYPKAGSDGADNLKKEAYKEIAENIKISISSGKLHIVNLKTKTIK